MLMEKVWHYTTLDSFQSMLNSSIERNKNGLSGISDFIFWASSICAMNDPVEYQYGYQLMVEKLLPQIEKELKIRNDLRLSQIWNNHKLTKNAPIDWNEFLINDNIEKNQTPFVISFSKQKDFLPMWNTYAGMGNGIALGFNNFEWMIKPKGDDDQLEILDKLHAKDVSYGEYCETTSNVIKDLYKRYYEEVTNISDVETRFKYMIKHLSTFSVIAAPYIKHKAYQYEKESRLIKHKYQTNEIKYRCNAKGRIIPYIEIPIKKEFLVEIIVGPCADFSSINRTLKAELLQLEISVPIIQSEVPYRIY